MSEAAAESLQPEEQARAVWYAVLSRLFYAAPDRAFVEALGGAAETDDDAGADGQGAPLARAWRGLQRACREADPDTVREEFETLFVGVGKAPVTPYTSGYVAPQAPDRHLLALRERLDALGLARREQVFETEDHVSAVCDALRWMIEHGAALDEQRLYFDTFVEPGVGAFCAAITRSPLAVFYRDAAAFAAAFIAVERDAFDMHLTA